MAELPDERQLVLGRVPSWTGGRRVLGERRTLNCSTATIPFSPRRDATARCARLGTGATGRRWCLGTDQYGIHDGDLEFEYLTRGGLRLPSTDHHRFRPPRRDDLDDETEERLNAALWKYSEHVATLIETQLNEFVHQN